MSNLKVLRLTIVVLIGCLFVYFFSQASNSGDTVRTLEITLLPLNEADRVGEFAAYHWQVAKRINMNPDLLHDEFLWAMNRMSLDNPLRGVANAPYVKIRFTNRSKDEMCFAKPIKSPGHPRSEILRSIAVVRTDGVPAFSQADSMPIKIVDPTTAYFNHAHKTRLKPGEYLEYPFWVAGGLFHRPDVPPGKITVRAKCYFLRGDMKTVETAYSDDYTFEVTAANVKAIRNAKDDD